MDIGQSSRRKNTKEVILNLDNGNRKKGGALVGKLITGKNMNKATVISMIKKGWQMEKGGLEIHELDKLKPIFLFRFDNEGDFLRILKGRPWSIQGCLLSLQVWEEYMVLKEVQFNSSPFWIQFHGLPLEAFDGENAITLGKEVGEVLMFENPQIDGNLTRSFIRVRCLIDLNEPLVTGFWVPRKDKDPAWVSVKYERLQNFCYKCGRLGHDNKNCKEIDSVNEDDEEDEYGYWMSTPHVKTYDETIIIHKQNWIEAREKVSTPVKERQSDRNQGWKDDEARYGKKIPRPQIKKKGEIEGSNLLRINEELMDGNVQKAEDMDRRKAIVMASNPITLFRGNINLSGDNPGNINMMTHQTMAPEINLSGGNSGNGNKMTHLASNAEVRQVIKMGRSNNPSKAQHVVISLNPSIKRPITSSIGQEQCINHSPNLSEPIEDINKAIVPYGALSPISQVTLNLNSINLKRPGSDDAEIPDPKRKTRLGFGDTTPNPSDKKKKI